MRIGLQRNRSRSKLSGRRQVTPSASADVKWPAGGFLHTELG